VRKEDVQVACERVVEQDVDGLELLDDVLALWIVRDEDLDSEREVLVKKYRRRECLKELLGVVPQGRACDEQANTDACQNVVPHRSVLPSRGLGPRENVSKQRESRGALSSQTHQVVTPRNPRAAANEKRARYRLSLFAESEDVPPALRAAYQPLTSRASK